MPSSNFPSKEVDIAVLSTELREFFETTNYDVNFREGAAGAIILVANKSGKPRDWVGLSLGATVRLNAGPEVTRIWVGNQKWTDKIAIGFLGIVLFVWQQKLCDNYGAYDSCPFQPIRLILQILSISLVVLPTIGAYWQHKVVQDAWNIVENHVAFHHTPTL